MQAVVSFEERKFGSGCPERNFQENVSNTILDTFSWQNLSCEAPK